MTRTSRHEGLMPLFGKRKTEQAEKLEAGRVLEDLYRADPTSLNWRPEIRSACAALSLWMERTTPGNAAHLLRVLESYKGHSWGGGKQEDTLEIFSQCVRTDTHLHVSTGEIGEREVVLDGAPEGSRVGDFILGPPPGLWGDPQGLLQIRFHVYMHVVAKFDDDLFALSAHRENQVFLEPGERRIFSSESTKGFGRRSQIWRRRIEKIAGR